MKKIKISELPLCSTLKGLFTIGTDSQNRSVKVSLQFVEDKVTEAVSKAMAATTSANSAAQAAQTAKTATETATAQAQAATEASKSATQACNAATETANEATADAVQATSEAEAATEASKSATQACNAATETANEATADAVQATSEAEAATAETLLTIQNLVPTGLTVEPLPRITFGNVNQIRIKAVLSPLTALKNLIYISDNRAVVVGTDGLVTPVAKGKSVVHVIPTCNTSLAKTLLVEVGDPTLRLVNTRTQLRFTQSGVLRLN
jgi:hypothetical protein